MALTERFVTADSDGGDGSSGDPWTLTEAFANAAPGDFVKIYPGTYALGATTPANAGTRQNPVIFCGVDAEGNPITPTRTNGSGLLITTGWPVIAMNASAMIAAKNYWIYQTLRVTGNTGGYLLSGSILKSGSVLNSATHPTAAGVNFSTVVDSDVDCPSVEAGAKSAIDITNLAYGCKARHSGGRGFGISGGVVSRCVAYDSPIGFMGLYGACKALECTAYNCDKAFSLESYDRGGLEYVIGCSSTDSATAFLDAPLAAGAQFIVGYNRTRDNVADVIGYPNNWVLASDWGRVVTDNGGPETDYRDTSTADFYPAVGSVLRNAGLGGVDCGAIQHVDPTQPATTTVWFGTSYNDGLSTGEMRASDIANCEAGNIKKDVVIDDVTGTMEHTGFVGVKAK